VSRTDKPIDADAIVILEIFAKKTARTPREVVHVCHQRLKRYDDAGG
jgi:phage-related protein